MTTSRQYGADAPLLLTPGPLTTAAPVRSAMLRDWGSREADFIALTTRLREKLLAVAGQPTGYAAIPLQGSGTFAVEAMIATFVPGGGKVLVLVNGSYGRRMVDMARRLGRTVSVLEVGEDTPVDPARVDDALARDKAITDVAAVHVETTSGLLNPIDGIAAAVAGRGRRLLIDAMSAFGALACYPDRMNASAIAASSNKCLEGVPGVGIVIAAEDALRTSAGHCPSLSLDLCDQWRGFEQNGQWRFTPPVQVVAALDTALDLLADEGGPPARLARYSETARIIRSGLEGLGLRPFLAPDHQAPIIITFHPLEDRSFSLIDFHDRLLDAGFAIYPGKITTTPTFRVGCIGQVFPTDARRFVRAVETILRAGKRKG